MFLAAGGDPGKDGCRFFDGPQIVTYIRGGQAFGLTCRRRNE